MAESRSWAIITALVAQLATITVANGYLTDAGLNIWTTDAQRPETEALGIMVYSESITGPGPDRERPLKGVRDITLLLEAAIGADQDNAQQQIHNLAEDIEVCMAAYAKQYLQNRPTDAMHVADIAILDRPEGMAVIAMQVRIVARYLR